MSYALEREASTTTREAIATLQRTAEAAGKRAWALGCHNAGAMWLSRDLAVVKHEVAALLAWKPQRLGEAERVLREAIARWNGVTPEPGDPLARMAQLGIPVVIAPPPPSASAILTKLAGQGATLALDELGQIVCLNASALGEHDRALVREHAEEIKRALRTVEVLA